MVPLIGGRRPFRRPPPAATTATSSSTGCRRRICCAVEGLAPPAQTRRRSKPSPRRPTPGFAGRLWVIPPVHRPLYLAPASMAHSGDIRLVRSPPELAEVRGERISRPIMRQYELVDRVKCYDPNVMRTCSTAPMSTPCARRHAEARLRRPSSPIRSKWRRSSPT